MMFEMTESAMSVLQNIVENEKNSSDEILYLRLSMGIG